MKKCFIILLTTVFLFLLAVPCLAATTPPGLSLEVRPLTGAELPAGATKADNLYGLFVRGHGGIQDGQDAPIQDLQLCFSFDDAILPFDTDSGSVLTGSEVTEHCFASLQSGTLMVSSLYSDSDKRTSVNCTQKLSGTGLEEHDLLVLYFQIRDNDPTLLDSDTFQLVTDSKTLASLGAVVAVYLSLDGRIFYVYGGDLPRAEVLESVPITGYNQAVSITGERTLEIPTSPGGSASLQFGVDTSGWRDNYTGDVTTTWSITDIDGTGAQLDQTGLLTVTDQCSPGTVEVRCDVQTESVVKTATAQVELTKDAPILTSLRISRDGQTCGETDTVVRPVEADKTWTYTYVAEALDQAGAVMNEPVTWTASKLPEGLSFENGVLSVGPEAPVDSTVELTASCGGLTETVRVTVTDLTMDWTAVEEAIAGRSLTYGQPVSALAVLPDTGSADAAGKALTGAFSYAAGNTVPTAGSFDVEVIFTITDPGQYAGTTLRKTFPIQVNKVPITVQPDNITVDYGQNVPDLTFAITAGRPVGSDTQADLGVTLTTDAAAGSLPGLYPINGTASSDNYQVTILEGTVTVLAEGFKSIAQSDGEPLPETLETVAWTIHNAADLGELLPSELLVTGASGHSEKVSAYWDTSLEQLQQKADTATEGSPAVVTVNLAAKSFPKWVKVPDVLPSVEITIFDREEIPGSAIPFEDTESVYGTAFTPKDPVMDETYGQWNFTYTYSNGSPTPPTDAGTYDLTITAENDRYRGRKTVTLTIHPRKLTSDMVSLTKDTFTYTGEAFCPGCTVSDFHDGIEWISQEDYTVSYLNNQNVPGSDGPLPQVVVDADRSRNYEGRVLISFTILPADLSAHKPEIHGTAAVGSVLTAVLPDIPEPEYTLQWYRDGVAIAGATGFSYTPTSDDSNRIITVQANTTGKNYEGSSTVSDGVTVERQAISGTVTIVELVNTPGGTEAVFEVGDTLKAMVQATPSVSLAYQWYLDGEAVLDATGETFIVPAGSSGKTIFVTVSPVSLDFTGTLRSGNVTVGRTSLQGEIQLAREGDTITATLTGNLNASSCTVVWLRNGTEIPGATGLVYTLTATDRNTAITVRADACGDYTGQILSEVLIVPPSVPAAPAVTVTAGDQQLTIQWTAGDTGGAPITGYQLTVSAGGQLIFSQSFSPETNSYTLSELVNGTSYTVTVSAVNIAGSGAGTTVSAAPKAPEGGDGGSTGGGGGGGGIPETPDPEIPIFLDVPEDSWAAPYIYDLCARGIVEGVGGDLFAPSRPITRAEFVKLLAGAAGADVTAYAGKSTFEDVNPDVWYAPYAAWAVDNGVTTGVSATAFRPDDTITREQMAAMLYRFTASAGLTLPNVQPPADFLDAGDLSPWAAEAVSALQQAGLIGGVGDGHFAPSGLTTREQSCKVLSLLLDVMEGTGGK